MLKRVQDLQKLIDSRNNEIKAIRAKADTENRQPNTEEALRINTFLNDLEVYAANLENCKREAGILERLNKPSGDPIRPSLDPRLDELQIKYPGLPEKDKRFAEGIRGLGEYAISLKRAAVNQSIDPRLRAASGMGEVIPSDGGFLVQQDHSTELLSSAFKASPVVSGCRKMTISANANGIKLPMVKETDRGLSTIYGALAMYWIGEGTEITAASVKFRQVAMEIKKVAALIPLTDEFIQDTTALGSFIQSFFPGALDTNMERVIIRGSGVAQPLGILNSAALISVAKEDGQLADTVEGMNIIKMFARMWATGMGTSVWLMSQSILPQLINMSLPGFPNIPLWLPPTGLSASPYGTIMGRPLWAVEHCSKLGDKGDIMFVDLNSYLLVDKGGPQNALSAEYRFPYDEQMLRITYRVDGQPLYVSAITPADASDTIGPFITLAERA